MFNYVDEGIFLRNGKECLVHCYLSQGEYPCNLCIPHYHRYIEILYINEGKIEVWINGKIVILVPGDMLIINSNVDHAMFSQTKYSYTVIKFYIEMLNCDAYTLNDTKYLIPLYRKDFQSKHLLKKDNITNRHIKNIVHRIYDEWDSEKYGYEIAIRGCILQLFAEIIRQWHDMDGFDFLSSYQDETINLIMSAADYCKQHYTDVTIEQLSKKYGLSYNYFSRTFKKVMNISFSSYINELKLSAAIHLLLTTNLNSTQIAYETGFSSTSYFIYNFRKKTGVTPSEYKDRFNRTMFSAQDNS